MTYTERDVAATIELLLADVGLDGPLTPDELSRLDQFHAGAADAVDRTIEPLHLSGADLVVDVGSGFGGPARRIAQLTGATVHGVDVTAAYVEAATYLTRRCGLEHLVSFEHTGIEDHRPVGRYTAAISMHVQMNVADKPAWYRAIGDVLDRGGQFVVWEICATGTGPLTYPMPWSIDGSDSHVVQPAELLEAITASGFEPLEWVDEGPWVNEWFAAAFAGGLPAGPVLAALLDDGLTRTINVGLAAGAGVLTVVRGRFARR